MPDNDQTERQTPAAAADDRRAAVKKILGAGTLAAAAPVALKQWASPQVESMLVPAHAMTTGVSGLRDPCNIEIECTDELTFNLFVTGFVIPPTPGITVQLRVRTANFPGATLDDLGPPSNFALVVTDLNGEYEASGSSDGEASVVQIIATLPDFPEAGEARCSALVTDDEFDTYEHGYGDNYFCTNAVPVR